MRRMRIGLYLARQSGGGMTVYAQALLRGLLEKLAGHDAPDDELVLYADSTVITEQLRTELLLSEVLVSEARGFDLGASRYFAPLQNGVRPRVLIRWLPEHFGRQGGMVLDQCIVPALAALDKLDLLHSVANTGPIVVPAPHIITVHDLYQGWPPVQDVSLRANIIACLYRAWFSSLIPRAEEILCDSSEVRRDVLAKFPLDPARVQTISLGLDSVFQQKLEKKDVESWAAERKLPQGYSLVLAGADKRKNLERTLQAWLGLDIKLRKRGLLVILSDERAKRQVLELLGDEAGEDYVFIVQRLSVQELHRAFAAAHVLCVPTIAEGFGLPALEARAMGVNVVSGPLEHLRGDASVYVCDPLSVDSIQKRLETALEAKKGAAGKYRTMGEVVKEIYLLYAQIPYRRKGGGVTRAARGSW